MLMCNLLTLYLSVLVTGDSAQLIQGHDIETLTEYGPLYFHCFTLSC